MVGSVLMQRMREESDFSGIEPVFFSTSNAGGEPPKEAGPRGVLHNAKDIKALSRCDVIVTCQGGDYTAGIYATAAPERMAGYWIDAASTLRMDKDAVIILDPVNGEVIQRWSSQGPPRLRRWQLHRQPDADGSGGLGEGGTGRMDNHA